MSLRTLLLLAMAYVLVLAIVAFGVPLGLNLRERVDSEVRFQASSAAGVLAIGASALDASTDRAALEALAQRTARTVRGRVIVVDGRGRVRADSATQDVGADYSSRPEIAAALDGREVQERRRSSTLGQELLVTAVPVAADGRSTGAVRITQGVGAVGRATRRNLLGLALVGLFVLLLGLAFASLLARRLAAPLRRLEAAAARVSAGELDTIVPETGSREQRELAGSFNLMTSRVARSLDAQRAFVADASHHLRTPLTAMRLRLEGLRGDARDPEVDRGLDAATDELDRLSRTIDELLILSAAGEPAEAAESVALASRARAAVARWEPAAAERGQELLLAQGRPGARVRATGPDVDRALDVLVDNALRYSPPDTVVTVTVDHATVTVTDAGPGLSGEDGSELFARFRRGQAGRRGPSGSGLGLAIARELAERWGGELSLRDGEHDGAVASLVLPEALSGSLPEVA